MLTSHEKERKSRYIQALVFGRVVRLAGIDQKTNPYPAGTDLWAAFEDGWSRELNDPVSNYFNTRKPGYRGSRGKQIASKP